MSLAYEDVLKRLKEERQRLGLSQNDMGQCLHISQSHYCKVESGFCRMSYYEMKYLCQSEIDVNYIYTNRRPSDKYASFLCQFNYKDLLFVLNIIYAIMKLTCRNSSDESAIQKMLIYVSALAATYNSENIYYILRKTAHISQSAMADNLGVNIKKLRNLENGIWKPDSEILFRLYKFYHVSPAMLLEDTKGLQKEICILLEMMDDYKSAEILEIVKRISAL